jgi:hypothetical protein
MYYIYHIEGIKIGCTNKPYRRIESEQKQLKYEILEEHNDIMFASKREIELQKQYGYRVDTIPYYESIRRINKASKIAHKTINFKKDIDWDARNKKIDFDKRAKKMGSILTDRLNTMRKLAAIKNSKSILAYDKNTLEFIGEYNSIVEASEKLNVSKACISSVCRKITKTSKNYTFKYK